MKEYIVYVKLVNGRKIVTGKMQSSSFVLSYSPRQNGEKWKLIYFEFKVSKRSAEAREKKLKALNKKILVDFVKKSNPELLDLKYTINSSSKILEELIY